MLKVLTCSAKYVSVQPETSERNRANVIKSVGGKYTCFSCSFFEEYSESGQGRAVLSVKFHWLTTLLFYYYVLMEDHPLILTTRIEEWVKNLQNIRENLFYRQSSFY